MNYSGALRIVAIGGGTGLSTLLKGLKHYATPEPAGPAVDITAIVTVTDDGGSSGRLRRELDVLPPGDIRNCMVALSEDEALLSRLFQYRFRGGRGLKGHSFGNLFLTALCDLTGDFATAIQLSSEVLASRGQIYPSTHDKVALRARLVNGTEVVGETRISRSRAAIEEIELIPAESQPLPETLEAISRADLITIGPGSLYTSIIPNLLVHGIAPAIAAARARKVYFVNLMWQPGETMHFSAADHVRAINKHARTNVVDTVVVNTTPLPQKLVKRYAAKRAQPVTVDAAALGRLGVKIHSTPLLAAADAIRHDPDAMAAVAVALAGESRGAPLK